MNVLNKAQRIAVISGFVVAVALFLVPPLVQVIVVVAATIAAVVALAEKN